MAKKKEETAAVEGEEDKEEGQKKEGETKSDKKSKEGASVLGTTPEERIDKVETISQTKKLTKKYGKVLTLEVIRRDPYLPRALEEKLRKELPKMRAITANELAAKNNVAVSTLRKFLYRLETEGILERVSSCSRLKVFNPKGLQ
jgi:ribosomal protein S25